MTVPSVENVNSRFRILDEPNIMPGKCAVCGGVRGPVVDFGLNIQFYGAVMLCVPCVTEAGDRVGMVRPEVNASDNLQTGQSVAEFLETHNLKVVDNGLHDILASLVASYIATADSRPLLVPSSVDNTLAGATQTRLALVVEPVESANSESDGNNEEFDLGVEPDDKQSTGSNRRR